MGNVFKLIRNWLSSQPDDDAKNVTHLDQSSCISTDPPVYSWLVRLLALYFGCHHILMCSLLFKCRDNKSEVETNQLRLNHLNELYIFRNIVYRGQQFKIENCLRSLILVTGFFDSIFVDDCKDCKIILGPVKGR